MSESLISSSACLIKSLKELFTFSRTSSAISALLILSSQPPTNLPAIGFFGSVLAVNTATVFGLKVAES